MTLPIYKYSIAHDDGAIEFFAPLIESINGQLLLTDLGLPFAISKVDSERLLVMGWTTISTEQE